MIHASKVSYRGSLRIINIITWYFRSSTSTHPPRPQVTLATQTTHQSPLPDTSQGKYLFMYTTEGKLRVRITIKIFQLLIEVHI